MMRSASLIASLLVLASRDVRGDGFLDTATQLKDQASAHVDKFTGYVDQAQSMVDQAQATVDGHLQKVKDTHAKATGYFDQMKDTVDGHVDKAKSLKEEAKSKFCGLFSVDSICGQEASPAQAVCTGPTCCMQSSCYSSLVPGFKCDSDRGATTCVGASLLSGKQGRCQCKFGSTCSLDGKCPSATGVTGLYEDGKVVPEEEFTLPFVALFGVVGSSLVLGVVATTRRIRSWACSASASHRTALIATTSAVE